MANQFTVSTSFSPSMAGMTGGHISFLDDSVFDVLEPDILASDGCETLEAKAYNGERRLMAAILVDGVEAYLRYHLEGVIRDPEVTAEELVSWIDDDSANYVFGFDTVCLSLGINPRYLRSGLRRLVNAMAERRAASAAMLASADGPIPTVFNGWKKIRRPRKRD